MDLITNKKALGYCLTENDILSIIHRYKTNTYPFQIITANNKHLLDTLYDNPITLALIHYQSSNTANSISGHWCGMIVNNLKKLIYFYDPYGLYPDNELKLIPESYRLKTNQCDTHIKDWLNKSKTLGYRVEYNHFKQQALNDHVNTCGRWVGYFLRIYSGGTGFIEEFNRYVKVVKQIHNFRSLDEAIVYITNRYLVD